MDANARAVERRRMISISWGELDEHIKKGDLKEWLNDELQADKLRQFEEDTKGCVRQKGEKDEQSWKRL